MPVSGKREDPLLGYNFRILIDGEERAGFMEFGPLRVELDVTDYREGNEGQTVRKIPGLAQNQAITAKQGKTTDTYLYDWFSQVYTPRKQSAPADEFRKNVDVVQTNDAGERVAEWRIYDMFPYVHEQSTLNALSSDVVEETLEFQHEGYVMTYPRDNSV